jgi:hypothetical protein
VYKKKGEENKKKSGGFLFIFNRVVGRAKKEVVIKVNYLYCFKEISNDRTEPMMFFSFVTDNVIISS